MTQPATPSRPRKWRRIALWCLLPLLIFGGILFWWGPWRAWDVSIKFLEFEDQVGGRVAVFEVQNRSSETLLIPKRANCFTYQLFPPGVESTHSGRIPGGWWGMEPGTTRKVTAPLICPDGTPVTSPFRVGIELGNLQGTRRTKALDKLPGWLLYWVYKAGLLQDKSQLFWTERVTP